MCYPTKTKLYSYEEEIEIFRVIRTGEAAEKLLSSSCSLDIDTCRELQADIMAGRSAKEEFINNNIPLCIAAAKMFHSTFICDYPEQKDDLISEATMGLMKAVEKFDIGFGTKFSTYAMFWIRRFMQRYIDKNIHFLSVSYSCSSIYSTIIRFIESYNKKHNKFPSVKLIASATGIPDKKVQRILMIMRSPLQLDKELLMQLEDLSVEQFGDNHEVALCESVDFDANLMRQEMTAFLQRNLYGREYLAIKYYFGFDTEKKTYEQIGNKFGVTRERVRQIINKSLGELKIAYTNQMGALY